MARATNGMSFPPGPLAMPTDVAFAAVIADSLRFSWASGSIIDVPAGYSTGWRVLPMALVAELRSGTGVMEIDQDPPRQLRAGDLLCIPAGTLHRVTHPVATTSNHLHAGFRVFATIDVLSLAPPPLILAPPLATRAGALIAGISALDGRNALPDVIARQALGLSLLHLLCAASASDPRALATLRAAQRLAPALAAIDADPAEVDLPGLARRAKLSPSRLHALFQEAFACSPMRYARGRRLQLARELLLGGDLPIAAVAQQCGFPDQFHFSRAFKRAHGSSPSAYRAAAASALL